MRLINTTTLKLVTFNDEQQLPPYAILSHRWVGGQEVLYKDLLKRRNEQLEGWWKIRLCCSQAVNDGLEYAWIDTCCIDKSSSAELSEAINSMFRWYGEARICYAYLNDVVLADNKSWQMDFTASAWFSRSWTLQELLAPEKIVFYDRVWTEIGVRSDLAEEIAEASGIQLSIFTADRLKLEDYSVAQRMSWASKRNATRVEDIAYSLLGIFDVNMPLLYGEGHKAFRRLQEEIIRHTHDHTIFAWSHVAPDTTRKEVDFLGLLAPSPLAFRDDFDLVQHTFDELTAYSITNLGLTMKAPLEPWAPNIYFVGLNCTKNLLDRVGIFLFEHNSLPGVTFRMFFDGKATSIRNLPKSGLESRQLTIVTVVSLLQAERLDLLRLKQHLAHVNIGKVLRDPERRRELMLLSYRNTGQTEGEHRLIPTIRCSGTRNDGWLTGVDVRLQAKVPCFGTFAIVLLPRDKYALAAFKVGLDKDFNLVCIFADHTYCEPHTGLRLTANKTYSVLDEKGGQSFWGQSCLEQGVWLPPSQEFLDFPVGTVPGLWALKGQARQISVFRLMMHTNHGPKKLSITIDGSQSDYSESQWLLTYYTAPLAD